VDTVHHGRRGRVKSLHLLVPSRLRTHMNRPATQGCGFTWSSQRSRLRGCGDHVVFGGL
jgi:hypothetical protein